MERLRGVAAYPARDIGIDTLSTPDGVSRLTEKSNRHGFPKKQTEAKVLYKHGHAKTGILSRLFTLRFQGPTLVETAEGI